MKIRIAMKTPDCVSDAVDRVVMDPLSEESENIIDMICKKWFRYGEICVLEVDTEKETISVIPAYTTTK